MNKPVRVIFLDEAYAEYKKLNEIVGQQLRDRKENTEEIQLLRSIKQKTEFVKANPFYGNNIPKVLIPQEYINNYKTKNLWRVELINYWRMLYTIKGIKLRLFVLFLILWTIKTITKSLDITRKRHFYYARLSSP